MPAEIVVRTESGGDPADGELRGWCADDVVQVRAGRTIVFVGRFPWLRTI